MFPFFCTENSCRPGEYQCQPALQVLHAEPAELQKVLLLYIGIKRITNLFKQRFIILMRHENMNFIFFSVPVI